MINPLIKGLETKDSYTENGMPTHSTTSDALVDFFAGSGAMRVAEKDKIVNLFSKAFNSDPDIAMKILFWARDIRGGAGERRLFRIICDYLAEKHQKSLLKNLKHIPTFGRYDDLLHIFSNTDNKFIKKEITKILATSLNNNDSLCAKWMPRKGLLAKQLRDAFGLTPKRYRKMLVELTTVVETNMCNNTWDDINFNHIPSLAMTRYKNSFYKHTPEIFTQWISDLKAGKVGVKVNTGAVYPYDITKSLKYARASTEKELANEQWKALPNWVPITECRIMPVVDVSGSMSWTSVSGETYPLDVAVSLGIYFSERNLGPYKDYFITFSSSPVLQKLTGDLSDRIQQLSTAEWEGSTNIQAVFSLILKTATTENVKESDMPTHIIIFSDMEFDSCTTIGGGKYTPTAMEMIRNLYNTHGYKLPNIIFWNLQKRNDNYVVKFDEAGTALISGFSPSIIRNLMDFVSPLHAMMKIVNDDRYKEIVS